MTVVVVTPPAVPLIDVPVARTRLGLDAAVSDLTLSDAIAGALQMLDGPAGTLGRAVLPQTLEMRMPGWAPRHDVRWDSGDLIGSYGTPLWANEHHWRHHGAIAIPFPPVASIVSITYTDATGAPQTLPSSAYTLQVDGDEARVMPVFGTTWPVALMQPGSVRIRYTAGYIDAKGNPAVPFGLTRAILTQAKALASLGSRDGFLRSEQVTGIGSTAYDTGMGAGAAVQAAVDAMLAPYRILSL